MITSTLFEQLLIMMFSPVANFGDQSLVQLTKLRCLSQKEVFPKYYKEKKDMPGILMLRWHRILILRWLPLTQDFIFLSVGYILEFKPDHLDR